MLVKNLQESSLVAMRTVYDALKEDGGVLNINITLDMLKYARSACAAYHLALEEKKASDNKEKKMLCEKRKAKAQIKVLEAKKQKLNRVTFLEVYTIDSQIAELRQQL